MTNQKEHDWHLKKVGKFSASRAKDLMSASGKWIEGNIDYLYEMQYQRLTEEPEPPISARAMLIGIENEPYAIDWARANFPDLAILDCSRDFTEKIFEEPFANVMFGVSPDAFVMKAEAIKNMTDGQVIYDEMLKSFISALLEIKCVVGRKETVRYFSPTLPIEIKKDMVKKEHGWQMAAQLFAYPNVQKIYLLKYLPDMYDFNEFDMRDANDPSRGIMFEFSRGELTIEIATFEHRLRVADAYLKSGRDLEKINDLKIDFK